MRQEMSIGRITEQNQLPKAVLSVLNKVLQMLLIAPALLGMKASPTPKK